MDVRQLRRMPIQVIEGDLKAEGKVLEFPGKLRVRGDVQDDCLILAASDVEVCGYVGAAGIRTRGDIRIHKGVAGQGYLDAGGDIHVRFVNNSRLVASGNIYVTTSVMHSVLSSESSIWIEGDEGFLVGGITMAACRLVATRVGSIYQTPTDLRVGMSPLLRRELARLQAEIEALTQRLESVRRDIRYLEQAGPKSAYADRLPLCRVRASYLEEQLHKQHKRYQVTQRALRKRTFEGDIQIRGPVHPGVSVNIGWNEYTLEQPLEDVRFFEKDGRIQWTESASL